jgi:hypothetical protein
MNERHLNILVRQYQITVHPHFNQELAFYQQLPTIDESIDYAALAKLHNGKRHPHQRRLKRQVLESVRQHLLANKHQLEQSRSFEDIFQLVRGGAVSGFGELAIYDTALRLAVRLAKFPMAVYLHAGTRKGAAALGLNVDRATIPMDELPGPLQKLEPDDAENFLCIYKDRLSKPLLPDEATPIGCTPQDRYVVGTEQIQTLAPRPCSPISKYE